LWFKFTGRTCVPCVRLRAHLPDTINNPKTHTHPKIPKTHHNNITGSSYFLSFLNIFSFRQSHVHFQTSCTTTFHFQLLFSYFCSIFFMFAPLRFLKLIWHVHFLPNCLTTTYSKRWLNNLSHPVRSSASRPTNQLLQ